MAINWHSIFELCKTYCQVGILFHAKYIQLERWKFSVNSALQIVQQVEENRFVYHIHIFPPYPSNAPMTHFNSGEFQFPSVHWKEMANHSMPKSVYEGATQPWPTLLFCFSHTIFIFFFCSTSFIVWLLAFQLQTSIVLEVSNNKITLATSISNKFSLHFLFCQFCKSSFGCWSLSPSSSSRVTTSQSVQA